MTKTERVLEDRLVANGFSKIAVTMKCNGDVVTIKPCSCERNITDLRQVEYFLVESPSLPWLGGDTLAEVARDLDRYSELLAERDTEINDLKGYILKHGEASDWGWVSDWHKDLFGHRPHVSYAQQIAWAESNEMCSAMAYAA